MVKKVLWTLGAFLLYYVSISYFNIEVSSSGTAAGGQLVGQPGATQQVAASQAMYGLVRTLAILGLFGLLLMIWWSDLKKMAKDIFFPMIAVAILLGGLPLNEANAFFSKTDKTEMIPVLPNESAFWIGDDDPKSQVQTDTEAFYSANKVSLRVFQVPHKKLVGSAGNSMFAGWDYFVPAGRMIKVDRTPYSREWVDAEDRGTSKKKEGFPCQTKEGLNIIAGVSIGVSVKDQDAAKFLHNFGVKATKGNLTGEPETDGPMIFTTVYYGRSLLDVMDDVGRKKIQTLVCQELAKRTFDKANEDMEVIMNSIVQDAIKYFASVGITMDFLGWGDTFEFDKSIQEAVNRLYIAKQDEAIAKLLAPHKETIQTLAAASALRAFGDKTDGKLPTTIVGIPPSIGALLDQLGKQTLPNK